MNIHLLKSPELNEQTYRNVLQLLQQFQGPFKFLECETENFEFNDTTEEVTWQNEKDFQQSKVVNFSSISKNCLESAIEFPFTEKIKSWDVFFAECDKFRLQNNISEKDIVVLLTDFANDANWFGSVSPSMKNYFIHTANWAHFFGNSIDIRFPIAYEVVVWVMRYHMFSSREEIMDNIHINPIGCVMDFCKDKSQIILKMRTADVCDKCIKHITDNDVPKLYTRQFFEILDGIRESLTFRKRAILFQKPSKLEIKGYTKKILLTDLGNLEIRLNPKEKALYLLYLNYPEGINLNELQNHTIELKKLYANLSNLSNNNAIDQTINLLVNPIENDINVILSRINKKIKQAVGESLYDFYAIKGERAESKKIKLDRELIKIT
jgi:hypothetical protein